MASPGEYYKYITTTGTSTNFGGMWNQSWTWDQPSPAATYGAYGVARDPVNCRSREKTPEEWLKQRIDEILWYPD